jgi:hypothetical protein
VITNDVDPVRKRPTGSAQSKKLLQQESAAVDSLSLSLPSVDDMYWRCVIYIYKVGGMKTHTEKAKKKWVDLPKEQRTLQGDSAVSAGDDCGLFKRQN